MLKMIAVVLSVQKSCHALMGVSVSTNIRFFLSTFRHRVQPGSDSLMTYGFVGGGYN